MADQTAIQWTDATWNPTTGCTKISPGCANCYIERTPSFRIARRRFDSKGHIPLQLHENRIDQPLHWRRPRRVFVNSQSDLFHEDVSQLTVDRVFDVMCDTPQHTYQILTKRPARMRAMVNAWHDHSGEGTLDNVWLGVTGENSRQLFERMKELRQTPAAIRFVSLEPLLEDVSAELRTWLHPGLLDWVIVGVEQLAGRRVGRNAAAYEGHARAVLQQCGLAGVAAFHKQMPIRGRVSGDPDEWPADLRVREYPPAVASA